MKIAAREFFVNTNTTWPSGVRSGFVQPIPHTLSTAWDMGEEFIIATIMTYSGGKRYYHLVGWGRNNAGQLGDNTLGNKSVPTIVAGIDTASFRDPYWVQASLQNFSVISANGDLHGTGTTGTNRNLNGNVSVSSPVQMTKPTNTLQFFKTNDNGYFLNNDGTMQAWGVNANGQVGDNSTTARTSPVAVAGGQSYTHVFPLQDAVFARTVAGDIYCWGRNLEGQLGIGDTVDRSSPAIFAPASQNNWVKFQMSNWSTIGLKNDGTVWVWGNQGNVTGSPTNIASPVQVTGLPFIRDIAGTKNTGAHAMALSTDGRLYGWGNNTSGCLGLNNTTIFSTPQLIVSNPALLSMRVSLRNSAYLLADGTMWSAGFSAFGAVGDNALTNRSVHVQVFNQFNDGVTTRPAYFVNQILPPGGLIAVRGFNNGKSIQPFFPLGQPQRIDASTIHDFRLATFGTGFRVSWFE